MLRILPESNNGAPDFCRTYADQSAVKNIWITPEYCPDVYTGKCGILIHYHSKSATNNFQPGHVSDIDTGTSGDARSQQAPAVTNIRGQPLSNPHAVLGTAIIGGNCILERLLLGFCKVFWTGVKSWRWETSSRAGSEVALVNCLWYTT